MCVVKNICNIQISSMIHKTQFPISKFYIKSTLFIKYKSIKGNNKSIKSLLKGLLHLGSCLGAGIVVGLSEGGIVVVGGNVVVKALGGKVDVAARMCGNVAMGGIVGISVKVAVGDIVGVSAEVVVGIV